MELWFGEGFNRKPQCLLSSDYIIEVASTRSFFRWTWWALSICKIPGLNYGRFFVEMSNLLKPNEKVFLETHSSSLAVMSLVPPDLRVTGISPVEDKKEGDEFFSRKVEGNGFKTAYFYQPLMSWSWSSLNETHPTLLYTIVSYVYWFMHIVYTYTLENCLMP